MARPDEIETFTQVFRERGLDAAIDSVARRQPPAASCSSLLRRVCEALEVTPKQLMHGGRGKQLSGLRAIAMWVCREATGASYPEIGKAMGGFHHTTVLHAVRRVDRTPVLLERGRSILAGSPWVVRPVES